MAVRLDPGRPQALLVLAVAIAPLGEVHTPGLTLCDEHMAARLAMLSHVILPPDPQAQIAARVPNMSPRCPRPVERDNS
jgi:hypothetical protein